MIHVMKFLTYHHHVLVPQLGKQTTLTSTKPFVVTKKSMQVLKA